MTELKNSEMYILVDATDHETVIDYIDPEDLFGYLIDNEFVRCNLYIAKKIEEEDYIDILTKEQQDEYRDEIKKRKAEKAKLVRKAKKQKVDMKKRAIEAAKKLLRKEGEI